ncbi:aliphatic sulfonate ABC transporter substrate-binding protein, partial [Hyphomicrobium sp.]|uniref:aliphatic sulfonate ABC transporter substrate-binding protein n=1 Tax=Hyphomicrobium sp. TaxID=82 RepID=UPI0025BFEAFD
MRYLNRLLSLSAVLGLALMTAAPGQADEKTVRIGLQKSSSLATILRTNGELEKRFATLGYKVTWKEFTSGLPLLEALNVGAIELSADVADTVPIFAQAAGAKLTYVAQEAPSPTAQAILVPPDSPLKSVADLKGKKIAFTKAAGVHFLLISALSKEGLKFSDIEPAYLTPADGRAAFEKRAVDAWVVWDPFVAAAQKQADARILSDGSGGIASYQRYYLASTPFATSEPKLIEAYFALLQETGKWVKANPAEAAKILGPAWGLETDIVEKANERRSYQVRVVKPEDLTEQQRIADVFFAEKVLPKEIKATEAEIWS